MGLVRPKPGTFDVETFDQALRRLLASHGLLAITAHVMVPLDADNHHVFRAEAGVTQLHIDLLEIGARHRPLPGGL